MRLSTSSRDALYVPICKELVDNYFMYSGKEKYIEEYSNSKKLFLYSQDRNERYPIFEDRMGHIS